MHAWVGKRRATLARESRWMRAGKGEPRCVGHERLGRRAVGRVPGSRSDAGCGPSKELGREWGINGEAVGTLQREGGRVAWAEQRKSGKTETLGAKAAVRVARGTGKREVGERMGAGEGRGGSKESRVCRVGGEGGERGGRGVGGGGGSRGQRTVGVGRGTVVGERRAGRRRGRRDGMQEREVKRHGRRKSATGKGAKKGGLRGGRGGRGEYGDAGAQGG